MVDLPMLEIPYTPPSLGNYYCLRFSDLGGEGDKRLGAAVHREPFLRHLRELVIPVNQHLKLKVTVMVNLREYNSLYPSVGVYILQGVMHGLLFLRHKL